jgi:hypothetical protein
VEKNLDYATIEDLIEQLHVFERQMGWSIFDILDILKQKKADSLSITKEKPFHYFYARLSEKTIIIRLQTSEKETEFRLPIERLKK